LFACFDHVGTVNAHFSLGICLQIASIVEIAVEFILNMLHFFLLPLKIFLVSKLSE
jgi:hypothetical protein